MKKSKRQQAADKAHYEWLKARGLDPQTLKKKLKSADQWIDFPIYVYTKVNYSNSIGSGLKTGVLSKMHTETKAVQEEILDKASRVMPLYNKGGLQYCTPDTDLTTVGTKSRR